MRSHRVPACVAALLVGATLAGAAQPLTGRHWVWFTDKGPNPPTGSFDDAPLYAPYLADVAKITEVHHVTRWFNGVSVTADEAQIERLRGLRFVLDVTPVGKWWRGRPPEQTTSPPDSRLRPGRTGALDYGASFSQMHMVKADSLHLLGLTGAGVRIAVFDDGFNYLDHAAFDRLRPHIVARYDFIDQDTVVAFDPDFTDHGTEVLSCLAAYAPGYLIGPAYDAEFLLARTENDDYERPVEEDNWVAAAEWAVAKGANIISSSIGYNWFEILGTREYDPDSSHTLDQLDGKTALITRAAQKAAGRGIVVVNAAGNERNQSGPSNWYWHGKLLMPADGDSVIAVGATYTSGSAAPFTSAGPTADGRIKPDVSALGVGVFVADPSYPGYVQRNGTSYATPVIAGVVAQLLQAHPSWDPIAVRTALRLSSSHALQPDTLTGWGVVDGMRALAADSAIFGRVVVDQTGEPNFGAYVQLYDVRDAPVTYSPTSTDGWYRMERIPPGTYHVKAFWNNQAAGAETTLTLPMLPREVHLRLRTSDSIAGAPRPALWWVSDPFPNPANPATTIQFRVFDQAAGDRVCLSIHTPTGQIVREVSVPVEPFGFVTWDGLDAQGREVASGVYLARLTFGNASVTRRVVLLR